MTIELFGLSAKQQALCDIMWALDSAESVHSFISTLPTSDQLDCRSLITLMQLSLADEVITTDQAQAVLAQFRK